MKEWERLNQEIGKLIAEDLLKTFKWLEYTEGNNYITYEGATVLHLTELDVNQKRWNNGVLEYQFTEFKFDGYECISLTMDNYERYKQVLRDYEKEYIKGEQ